MSKAAWAIAQSPILTTTITLKRLAKRGYECVLDCYLKVRPEQTFMGSSFTL
jgi:RNA-directed DNA polymerase